MCYSQISLGGSRWCKRRRIDAGGHSVKTHPAVTMGSGEVGEGPMEGTGEDGEVKRCEGEVVRSGCVKGPLPSVGGIWEVE